MSVGGALPQRALLQQLAGAGVDFVLVGGLAVAAHGYVRATEDVDVVFSVAPPSCRRFAGLLAELRAEVQLADQPVPDAGITAEWLSGGGHFRFATEAGPLDALSAIAGLDYGRLAASADRSRLGGLEVLVCSYRDLVTMKSAGGRPRDEVDLAELRRIRGD